MPSFFLHSRNTVTPDGVKEAFVLIEKSTISDVLYQKPETTSPIITVGDKVLMPGVIDPHVHINEPGRTDWEGFNTATKAAIAGGVTTLVDMPLNSSPVTTTADAFDKKVAATRDQLHCNIGFWGGIVPGNENEIEPLIQKRVLGFKAFLTHSGIDEFPNVTEEDLRNAMPVIAKNNLPLLVHCELASPIENSSRIRRDKIQNTSYQDYLHSRPNHWEDDAIRLMIELCEKYNCHVHIVHLSSADSIQQIQEAKQKELPVTVETAQHYLFFNAEEIKDGQTQFKCAPPIREKENNEQLWQALRSGIIDFVATDHSPSTPDLKELDSGNFQKAWGGIASIQLALPALWTAAKKRGSTLNDLTRWLCENPAKLIGLENSKGKIQKDFDADLIIWDAEKKFTVTEEGVYHKHKITPYLGKELFGVVEQTFLKGKKIFDQGKFDLNNGQVITK